MDSNDERLAPIVARMNFIPGVDVGPGWYDIIIRLNEQIASLVPDYEVHQIKEKFGGLRYYISSVSDDVSKRVYALIDAAEAESYRTCEECGEPGKRTESGWVRTLCNVHMAARNV